MRRLVWLAFLAAVAAGCGSGGHRSAGGEVAQWVAKEHLPAAAAPGAKLFLASGCTACHTYAGSGKQVLGAPDLTAIGTRHLGVAWEIRHLKCPSCVNPGSPMPPSSRLGEKRLRELAIFLEASKGAH